MDKQTQQLIFDKAYKHSLTMEEPARKTIGGGSFRCAYRGENKGMCLIGCNITDENYTPDLEGLYGGEKKVVSALSKSLNIYIDDSNGTSDFLNKLQECHDLAAFDAFDAWDYYEEYEMKNRFKNRMATHLKSFSVRYDLKVPNV